MAYFAATGVDSVGQEVCHTCDNPICCNPAHLFLGDRFANMQDAGRKGRLSVPRPPRHKLTVSQVEDVRRIVATGPRGTAAALAAQYGVSQAHISQLVLGKARRFDAPIRPRLEKAS